MVLLIIILAGMALVGVLFMACVSEIERRHALWEMFNHPPDSEVKNDEQP